MEATQVSEKKTVLITGGAGFIGSHVVRCFVKKYPEYHIINLDALTYAGNPEYIRDVEKAPNYTFVQADIGEEERMNGVFEKYRPQAVIHLAAESHVDRSIDAPKASIQTNVMGTVNLLEAAYTIWKGDLENKLFYHISTDEVFGTLGPEGFFTEESPYDPKSPYSASKAASDHIVRAFGNTYGLPFIISNCSNNYGPCQFPEKLIPALIHRIKDKKPLPIYGDGRYTRDWLYVKDHAHVIDLVFHKGRVGESYNVGTNNEWKNIDLVRLLCKKMDKRLGRENGSSEGLISFVKDRPGHDRRYAIDANKIQKEFGWQPLTGFEKGLDKTIDWYLNYQEFPENIT